MKHTHTHTHTHTAHTKHAHTAHTKHAHTQSTHIHTKHTHKAHTHLHTHTHTHTHHLPTQAARSVSEVEVRKRVAAEHEVATLKRLLADAGRLPLPGHHHASGPAGAASALSSSSAEGKEEEDDEAAAVRSVTSHGEVTSLVLREQLSGLRDLKPAFHETYDRASTEWKVRRGCVGV